MTASVRIAVMLAKIQIVHLANTMSKALWLEPVCVVNTFYIVFGICMSSLLICYQI